MERRNALDKEKIRDDNDALVSKGNYGMVNGYHIATNTHYRFTQEQADAKIYLDLDKFPPGVFLCGNLLPNGTWSTDANRWVVTPENARRRTVLRFVDSCMWRLDDIAADKTFNFGKGFETLEAALLVSVHNAGANKIAKYHQKLLADLQDISQGVWLKETKREVEIWAQDEFSITVDATQPLADVIEEFLTAYKAGITIAKLED